MLLTHVTSRWHKNRECLGPCYVSTTMRGILRTTSSRCASSVVSNWNFYGRPIGRQLVKFVYFPGARGRRRRRRRRRGAGAAGGPDPRGVHVRCGGRGHGCRRPQVQPGAAINLKSTPFHTHVLDTCLLRSSVPSQHQTLGRCHHWTRSYDPDKYPFLTQQTCSSGPIFCAATGSGWHVLLEQVGGVV